MKSLKDFDALIQPDVQGCPTHSVREATREALDIFLIKTKFWEVQTAKTSLFEGKTDYDIDIDPNLRVIAVMNTVMNGNNIIPINQTDVDTLSINSTSNYPLYYSVHLDDDAQFIRFYPTPSQTISDAYYSRVAVKLKSNVDGIIPDYIYEDYRRVIASGALGRLLSTPGKTWTNPELAIYHKQLFSSGMNEAVAKKIQGFSSKRLVIKPGRFG